MLRSSSINLVRSIFRRRICPSGNGTGHEGIAMSRHFLLLTACAAVLALCSCASTPLTSTWAAPDVRSLDAAGKTIAVVFISRDEKARRALDVKSQDVIPG